MGGRRAVVGVVLGAVVIGGSLLAAIWGIGFKVRTSADQMRLTMFDALASEDATGRAAALDFFATEGGRRELDVLGSWGPAVVEPWSDEQRLRFLRSAFGTDAGLDVARAFAEHMDERLLPDAALATAAGEFEIGSEILGRALDDLRHGERSLPVGDDREALFALIRRVVAGAGGEAGAATLNSAAAAFGAETERLMAWALGIDDVAVRRGAWLHLGAMDADGGFTIAISEMPPREAEAAAFAAILLAPDPEAFWTEQRPRFAARGDLGESIEVLDLVGDAAWRSPAGTLDLPPITSALERRTERLGDPASWTEDWTRGWSSGDRLAADAYVALQALQPWAVRRQRGF